MDQVPAGVLKALDIPVSQEPEADEVDTLLKEEAFSPPYLKENSVFPKAKGSIFPKAKGSIVREVGPPIYYLKNKEGRLVPVLGFEYEDFMKLLRQKQRDPESTLPVQFTIDQAKMSGTVQDGHANLDIQLNVTTRQDGMIRVPVGLSQAIVRENLKYQGDGSAFLDYDAKRNEYVVWVEGKKDQKHKLLLSVAISTATIGLDTRLRFDAPRSTRSRMSLLIPEIGLDIHAPVESRLTVAEGKGEEKETRLTIDSVRGDFQLLWHKPQTGSTNVRTVVEASGEIIVNVGSLDMTCEALLNVQGRGMPLDRFRVRLPKGTTDYQVSDGDYQVIEVDASKSAKQSKAKESSAATSKTKSNRKEQASSDEKLKSRVIEVRLSQPTLEPVLLHLTTTRPLDKLASSDWIEPVGFEVIDAVRQWGYVATVVGPDHFVSWLPERGIRRIDSPPSTMNVEKPSAVFEYYSAPFLLKSRIAPRRTRVSVEPEHIVLVGAEQLQIESVLRYTIRGKSILSLELDLGDWELDDIGPETLVDVNEIEISPTGMVTVPLLRPTIGHARLTLKAHRAAPQHQTKLEVAFPRPRVDSPGPAVVVILPDNNVKLLPDADASTGLSRLQATPAIRLPIRQQSPLFYRGDAGQATFSAERSIHERQVSVDIRSTVTFEMLTADVEQSLIYQIDHEPIDQIVLDVPKSLVKTASLEFLVNGVAVVPRALNKSTIKQPETNSNETEADRSLTGAMSTSNDEETTSTVSESEDTQKAATTGKVKENKTLLPSDQTSTTPIASEDPLHADSNVDSDVVSVVLALKSPRIGKCVVTVRYSLPRQVLIPNTPLRRQVPLVLPSSERIVHHELSIISTLGLTAKVLSDQTKQEALESQPSLEPIFSTTISKSDQANGKRQNFSVTGRLAEITVLVTIEKRREAPSTAIQRAFFQTWVTDKEYLNRALFQFQTRQKKIELTLPPETIDQRVRLVLNGKPLALERLGEHRYLITFPNDLLGLQQLELRWSSSVSSEDRTVLSLGMPRLGKDAWIQRWYWQLLLPTGEHLLDTPHQILSESVWKWSGGLFQRESLMKTAELEEWVGAEVFSTDTPAANVYLFSSFGEPEAIRFRVANRSLIVLIASGLVLICGFLLIYIPATRHAGSLLVLGVVLGSFGVIYPEPMLLGLQASSIGVILVGLSTILKRRVSRPQLPIPIPIAEVTGSSILDRDSTQRQIVLPPGGNHLETTETNLRPPE